MRVSAMALVKSISVRIIVFIITGRTLNTFEVLEINVLLWLKHNCKSLISLFY